MKSVINSHSNIGEPCKEQAANYLLHSSEAPYVLFGKPADCYYLRFVQDLETIGWKIRV